MIDRNGEYPARIVAVRVSGSVSMSADVVEDAAAVTYDAQSDAFARDAVFLTGATPANRRGFNDGVRITAAKVGDPCWIRVRDETSELIVFEGGFAEECDEEAQVLASPSLLGRLRDALRGVLGG